MIKGTTHEKPVNQTVSVRFIMEQQETWDFVFVRLFYMFQVTQEPSIFCLFVLFWLSWVFVAVPRLSLVAVRLV